MVKDTEKKEEEEQKEEEKTEEKKEEETNEEKKDEEPEKKEEPVEEEEEEDEDKPEGIVESVSIDVKECPVRSVVVYIDRAEVCRSFTHNGKHGDNEILLKNLSAAVDKDSIRVEGSKPAIISEVTYIAKHIPSEQDESNARTTELEKEVQEKKRQRKVVIDSQKRLRKQRDVLDGVANNIMQVGDSRDKEGKQVAMASMLDTKLLDGIQGFFKMYDSEAERLDKQLHQLDLEVERLDKEIHAVEKNISQVKSSKDEHMTRDCAVIVDMKKDAEVELHFSYVVSKAKWSPKYDIRVFSNDKSMKIMYFGVVEQATGEDWSEAKLSLSTAVPSIGGQIPSLGTQQLHFKPRPVAKSKLGVTARTVKATVSRVKSLKRSSRPAYLSSTTMMNDSDVLVDMYGGELDTSLLDEDHSVVKEGITSTSFEISRKHSIPCDAAGHKVAIGIINLKPDFEYECVPKKGARAYLKSRVKNTSEYALLAGPANIFLDNNFIAKSELKAVSPEEDFSCSLGVDPAIRVTYNPVHKFRDHAGVISKSVQMHYKQPIQIKNTRGDPIKIVVVEQVPLSTEEKIKVKVIEPSFKEDKKAEGGGARPAKMNKANNIEWEVEVAAGDSHDLMLHYTVDYPHTEDIEASLAGSETVV